MVIDQVAKRMTALAAAFRAYQETVPGLTVEVVGRVTSREDLVHPVAGFHVRIPAHDPVGGVQLYVSESYAELTRWGDGGAIRERFRVQLQDEYGWGDSAYPDADALAHDLIAYLQFTLDAVAR